MIKYILIAFILLCSTLFSQSNKPVLLRKNKISLIIENFTSTNASVVQTDTYRFIDSLGFNIRSVEYLKNGSKDSSLTLYRYDDSGRCIREVTTSNYEFSSEHELLDSVTFSDRNVFKEISYNWITRIKRIGGKEYTYINDTLQSIRSSRNRKTRQRCKVVHYDKAGRRMRVAQETYCYNKAQQCYKFKSRLRGRLLRRSYSKKRQSYFVASYFYDEAGLLTRTTSYSSFTKSSVVTDYTYVKRDH